jgi:hypothetical protein
MDDLTTLTADELSDRLNAILNEQERRANLARIPTQIEELRQTFLDGGGDPAALDA